MPSSAMPSIYIYSLSLHDALPIWTTITSSTPASGSISLVPSSRTAPPEKRSTRSEEHTSELQSQFHLVCRLLLCRPSTSTLFPYTTLFLSGRRLLPLRPLRAVSRSYHRAEPRLPRKDQPDRKSTRLNSSHSSISYAVFCYAVHLHLLSFPTRRSSYLDDDYFLYARFGQYLARIIEQNRASREKIN